MFEEKVFLVIDHTENDGPSAYAKDLFFKSLKDKGGEIKSINYWTEVKQDDCIVMGRTDDWMVHQLLEWNNVEYTKNPEGTIYQWCNTGTGRVLVVAGTDENGLMYALLELVERIDNYGLASLIDIKNQIEYPENKIRSVSRFVMSKRDDEWFYSEEFWNYYFARLAKYRFNRYVMILGFDTPYMSPPYPFFVDVPGYPNVKVKDMKNNDRQRNLNQLRRIGQLCKKFGIEFNLATWQQTPWTGNQKLMVEGLAKDEGALGDYCAAGLKELLIQCPEIEVLQLRVNHEAGVGTQITAEEFWKKLITVVSEVGHKVKLDLRAKGLTDGMIQFALEKGLELDVPTKYWCEHVALPYHISKMRQEELERLHNFNHSRRYSYANLLRKPHFYDVIYRLWNYGSNTIFLWGDPDFVKRFSYSLNYGQSVGFEITAPLSLKGGQASFEDEAWPLFDDKSLVHYKWEDERYWAYYLFFGRLTYCSKTAGEVWHREFAAHFGSAASYMEDAYRSAGKILPLITTYHMPVHPSLCYWPEICTGGALFDEHNFNKQYHTTFQDSEPSDSGLFYGITEYAEDVLSGKVSSRYTPIQVRDWLTTFLRDIRCAVEKAESINDIRNSTEFKATKVDLLMQADLAEYHTKKIMAALELSFYLKTNNIDYLKKAYKYAVSSLECWRNLSERGSVYHSDLQFGVGGVGRSRHWKDRLTELEKDVAKLKSMLEEKGINVSGEGIESNASQNISLANSLSYIESDVPKFWKAGKDLVVNVKVGELIRFCGNLKMHYRHMNQLEGRFIVSEMEKTETGYQCKIGGDYITYEWDIMVYFSGVDKNNNVTIYPGVYHPQHMAPYHVVKIIK